MGNFDLLEGARAALASLDPVVVVVCCALCLLVATVLCVLFSDGEGRGAANGLGAFVNFDRLVLIPLSKFLYLLLACAGIAFPVASAAVAAVDAAAGSLPWSRVAVASVSLLVAAGLFQVVLRFLFELLVVVLRMLTAACGAGSPRVVRGVDGRAASGSRDVPASREGASASAAPRPGRIGEGRPELPSVVVVRRAAASPVGPAPIAPHPPAARPQAPVAFAPGVAGLSGPGFPGLRAPWDCPRCGARENTGAFCGICGQACPAGTSSAPEGGAS